MDKPIIEIKNIGKKYNITHQRGGYVALRDVLMNVFKSPFSFLKTKAKQVSGFEKKEEFWALKNVNFTVQKGEVIGIIGGNGAGKSTLLKILSQITPPTEGEIVLRGKVGSLLEVGTGFHPELTGRENIFLNGAILGMKKKEIAKKFDEIVEFAGIGKFLDTPVKYYSSGMYVRLAFSVAAHMEPDILMVDEVLAVGDAEFQKKCLGKMEDITKKEGRTILFVSHNMEAVKQLCPKCMHISEGRIKNIGDTKEVVAKYLGKNQTGQTKYFDSKRKKNEVEILKMTIRDDEGNINSKLDMSKPFFIEIEYQLKVELQSFVVLKIFKSSDPSTFILFSLSNDNNQKSLKEPGLYKAVAKLDPLLNSGFYSVLAGIATNATNYLDRVIEHNIISIYNSGKFAFPVVETTRENSLTIIPLKWSIERIK